MKNKIKIKNEVPELLEAVCTHKDCPEWLQDAIWEAFNKQNIRATYSADYWRGQLGGMFERKSENSQQSGDSYFDNAAVAISSLLNNPNLPEPLYDGIQTALTDTFNDSRTVQEEFHEYEKTPEYIAKVLRGFQGKQSEQ